MSEIEEHEEWTSLKQAAVALHEMFSTLVDSGFTEEQGLRLVAYIIEDFGGDEDDDDVDEDNE